jgi:exosortase
MGAATAQTTQAILDILGVAVTRSGNVLTINTVDVGIAEACNGLRMVFTLCLVSFAFAFGSPLRRPVQVLIIVATPAFAILCNVVRLAPTVWLYGTTPTGFADGFHEISGWVMLVVAFLMLYGTTKLLERADVPVTHFKLAYE